VPWAELRRSDVKVAFIKPPIGGIFGLEMLTIGPSPACGGHVLDVRYKNKGKLKTYVQLGAVLATRKVSVRALKKGMTQAKIFSKPETFLRAHQLSETAA